MAFSGFVAIIAVLFITVLSMAFFLLAGLPVQWFSDGLILLFIAVLSMSVFLLAGLMVQWFSDG